LNHLLGKILTSAKITWWSNIQENNPSTLAAKQICVSLALYSWRILLGGFLPRTFTLAVYLYYLAVFDRQGKDSLV
jgi:hypothetical protein